MIVPFENRNIWNEIFEDLKCQKKYKNVIVNPKAEQYKNLHNSIEILEKTCKEYNIVSSIPNELISCFDYFTRNYGLPDYDDKFGYSSEYGDIKNYSLKDKINKELSKYTEQFMDKIGDDTKHCRREKINSLVYFQVLRMYVPLSFIGVTPNQAIEILSCLLNLRRLTAGKNQIKKGIKEICIPDRYICKCAGVRMNREKLYATLRQLQRTGLLNFRWSNANNSYMVSPNWDILLEDKLIQSKCKRTFNANVKVYGWCLEKFKSIKTVGHTYQYNMDYKKEILIGLGLIYTAYGLGDLYNVTGTERGELGDRLNKEITYIEIPYHLTANILNEREDEQIRYMRKVCSSCNYISVKDKCYITKDNEPGHHRLHKVDKEWQYQNTLVNYKDAVKDDIKRDIKNNKSTLNKTKKLLIEEKVHKQFTNELEDKHPLTTNASFIIHNDNFFKTKLSKRIIEHDEDLKKILILQILELIMDWYTVLPTKKDQRILPGNYYIHNSKVESPEYFHLVTDIQRNRKGKLTGLVENDIFLKINNIDENNQLTTVKLGTRNYIKVTEIRKTATIHVLEQLLNNNIVNKTKEELYDDNISLSDCGEEIADYFLNNGTTLLNLTKLKTEKRQQDYNSKPVRLKFKVASIFKMNYKSCINHIKEVMEAILEDSIYELKYYLGIFNKLVNHLNLLKHIDGKFMAYIKNVIECKIDTNDYTLLKQLGCL